MLAKQNYAGKRSQYRDYWWPGDVRNKFFLNILALKSEGFSWTHALFYAQIFEMISPRIKLLISLMQMTF